MKLNEDEPVGLYPTREVCALLLLCLGTVGVVNDHTPSEPCPHRLLCDQLHLYTTHQSYWSIKMGRMVESIPVQDFLGRIGTPHVHHGPVEFKV